MKTPGPPRRRRWQWSIRSRIVSLFAAVVALIALFVHLYFPYQLEQHAREAVRSKGQSIAGIAAYGATAGLVFDDLEALRDVLASVRQDPDVTYALVRDSLGRTVAESRRDPRNSPTGTEVLTATVTYLDRAIGAIEIGISLEAVHAHVRSSRTSVTIATLIILAFGLLAAYGIGTLVAAPLRRIVRTVRGVSAGDLAQRTHIRTADDLGYLGRAFDRMVARLQRTQTRLHAANRRLESRVAARTSALQREVEERTRAEEALRESEHQFRTMIDSAAMGVMLVDAEGHIIEANPALAAMLGHDRGDLLALPAADLIRTDDGQPWRGYRDVLRGDTPSVTDEIRCRAVDGRLLWGRAVASAVRDRADRLRFAIVMIESTTERKELEAQLLQAQKLEAVGQLAGGIAHDFNNLLTTINGLSALVLEELDETDRVREDLEQIRAAGERAATLTAQLLAFSRKQIVQFEVLDLSDIIYETAGMLARMIGENISLELDLATDLPALRADRGQLTQILMNLVVNARDAMPTGGAIRIAAHLDTIDEPQRARLGTARTGDHIRLDVADTGTGIDEHTLARIFEPFFTTKAVGKGTGLGLATVYGIVKQAGGGIDVSTAQGRGTTFSVFLPVATVEVSPVRVPQTPPQDGSGGETILVVEDEDAVRALVVRVLRSRGYLVLEAANGPAALDVAEAHDGPVHLVVTDVIMPGMSGPELVRRLVESRPELSIIYMSGYTQDEVLHHGVRQDVVSFLEKPMSPAALAAKVREALDGVPA